MASGKQNSRTNVRDRNRLENVQETETRKDDKAQESSRPANVQVTDSKSDQTQGTGRRAREGNSNSNSACQSVDSMPIQRDISHQEKNEIICRDNEQTLRGTVEGSSNTDVYSSPNKLKGMANEGSSQINAIQQAAGQDGRNHEAASADKAVRRNHEAVSADKAVSATIMSNGGCRFPKYSTLAERQSSFTNWPAIMSQTPEQLAEAGFFYTGLKDVCTCFTCGIKLLNWKAGDDPITEHVRNNPDCEYINTLPGRVRKKQIVHSPVEVENTSETRCTNNAAVSSNSRRRQPPCSKDSGSIPCGDEIDIQPFSAVVGVNGSDATQNVSLVEPITPQSCFIVDTNHGERTVHNMPISVPEDAQYQYGSGVSRPTYFTSDDRVVICTSSTRCFTEQVISLRRQRELRQIVQENSRLRRLVCCTVCRMTERSMIFLPCRHFVCCIMCGRNTNTCPVCNTNIYWRLRTYGDES